MKIKELFEALKPLVERGHGDIEVLIDTESRTYNAHLFPIDHVQFEETDFIYGRQLFIVSPSYDGTDLISWDESQILEDYRKTKYARDEMEGRRVPPWYSTEKKETE